MSKFYLILINILWIIPITLFGFSGWCLYMHLTGKIPDFIARDPTLKKWVQDNGVKTMVTATLIAIHFTILITLFVAQASGQPKLFAQHEIMLYKLGSMDKKLDKLDDIHNILVENQLILVETQRTLVRIEKSLAKK